MVNLERWHAPPSGRPPETLQRPLHSWNAAPFAGVMSSVLDCTGSSQRETVRHPVLNQSRITSRKKNKVYKAFQTPGQANKSKQIIPSEKVFHWFWSLTTGACFSGWVNAGQIEITSPPNMSNEEQDTRTVSILFSLINDLKHLVNSCLNKVYRAYKANEAL